MLSELHVRDLGVIAELTVELGPGMTVLTGETGAGKTLLVHALQLVLGGRATAEAVRAGADEALVEARFTGVRTLPGHPVDDLADPEDAAGSDAEGEVILARTVAVAGRSRAWVDGRMAPVAALARAGSSLVDIHGQHDHQALLTVAAQRAALDEFAGADLGPLGDARRQLGEIERRLAALGGDERDRARHADLLRYQVAEIDAAAITGTDEDTSLAAQEELLSDAATLRERAAGALRALEGGDADGAGGIEGGASGLLGSAITQLAGREAFSTWEGRLRAVVAEVDDVAADLARTAESWEDDPARLAAVQARRHRLAELRRKYGATLADVLAFAVQARQALDEVEHQEEQASELEAARAAARRALESAAAALRLVRAEAAPRLGVLATQRLQALAMPGAALEVTIGPTGAGEEVTFLLGANPGEPLQPLARVASGGELARTMLALRLVVEGGAPTMLFDEVDAGVGGAAALALASALREVAERRQVVVVTHLAQVAAVADHHVAVRKMVDADGRAVTTVEVLGAEDRVVELARMLSGHPDSRAARAHASELLEVARRLEAVTGGVTAPR